MKSTSPLCAAALLTLAISPAFAEPVVTGQRPAADHEGRATRVVAFNDLDLATPAGEKALMRRVSGAVRFVCSAAGDYVQEASCHTYAWKGARPQIELALDQSRTNPTLASATLSSLTISAPAR
ncbi:UrcA family protein [Sphingomonas parva]|nr:UrcA family protein [Sphingomonas parva]